MSDGLGGGPPGDAGARSARDAVRATIVDLVQERGATFAEDPRRIEGFLRDLCEEHSAEISVAVAALQWGILAELRSRGPGRTQPSLLLSSLAGRLHAELGMDEALARWVVGTWMLAVGVADQAAVNAVESASAHGAVDAAGGGLEATRRRSADRALEEETAETDRGRQGSGTVQHRLDPARLVRTRRARLAAFATLAVLVLALAAGVVLGTGVLSGEGARGRALAASSYPFPAVGRSTRTTAGWSFQTPRFGTYRYATTITGGSTSTSGAAPPGQSVSTAEMIRVGDQVGIAWTGFGNTLVESDLYTFSPQRVVETSTELLDSSGAAASTACVWTPPITTYEQPLGPGRSWSVASSCTFSAAGGTGSIKMTEQARMVKFEQVSVPLGTYDAVLIDLTETTTAALSGGGSQTDHQNIALALDPSTTVPISEALYDTTTGQTVMARLEGFSSQASPGGATPPTTTTAPPPTTTTTTLPPTTTTTTTVPPTTVPPTTVPPTTSPTYPYPGGASNPCNLPPPPSGPLGVCQPGGGTNGGT